MSNQNNLSKREETLLKSLVESFICDGQPVGSSKLSNIKSVNLSSATIRNVFTDLEEKTLLEISFELTIDPQKIPGVPSILAKGLVKKVEPIISKEVAKNLEKTAREVELFIQKTKP